MLEEAERSIHDALCVIRCLVKKRALVPGLRNISVKITGLQLMFIYFQTCSLINYFELLSQKLRELVPVRGSCLLFRRGCSFEHSTTSFEFVKDSKRSSVFASFRK